ncbi:uncharacterized protein LOC119690099 [Teleopsis dalmanni]|uniref:uncharacterized protein LOC119690030 n=1 Tax=Teleopsis dalmanni TaxID=139649 RepID=UPI0018CFDDD9|nr:uncharacterized protein LOC119690030 [Teleopsis dalmanni]XP_037960954.1 uncharacterized protein LOC119690044 [Teleopsis dalmanni]XP_037961020.1 uncharacterized protein LOC119690099 [Teleopsis dalmanni]
MFRFGLSKLFKHFVAKRNEARYFRPRNGFLNNNDNSDDDSDDQNVKNTIEKKRTDEGVTARPCGSKSLGDIKLIGDQVIEKPSYSGVPKKGLKFLDEAINSEADNTKHDHKVIDEQTTNHNENIENRSDEIALQEIEEYNLTKASIKYKEFREVSQQLDSLKKNESRKTKHMEELVHPEKSDIKLRTMGRDGFARSSFSEYTNEKKTDLLKSKILNKKND